MVLVRSPLVQSVIRCAMDVHSELGPGLLESPYRDAFRFELSASGIRYRSEVMLPVRYKDVELNTGFRADFVIEEELLVEFKSVSELLPIHSAQVIIYLKLSKLRQ